ncbi:MAG TPA: hypothetical protein VKP69_27820 [Isosphaeraceae bacterium]|nr:hypothetical protein [Isosphaeraceae bacterium]
MSVPLSLPWLWSQAIPPNLPAWQLAALKWLLIFGEPAITIPGLPGGLITWIKVVSLVCLLGWVASWIVGAIKERTISPRIHVTVPVALSSAFLGLFLYNWVSLRGQALLGRVDLLLAMILWAASGMILLVWLESCLWSSVFRSGKPGDRIALTAAHVALILGFGLAVALKFVKFPFVGQQNLLALGVRLGTTYMGYVVLLRVLALLAPEVAAIRWRRLYSMSWMSVIEANRRMWAPWVVLMVFLVVLAFTHWFLTPPRPAEMGRLFVGTLLLLCSLLLTVMVTLLTPLSLPTDIQQQTISTVVSKPVRRIELIWGRMIGFMAIVTALVLAFGGISLAYLWRTVNGTIRATEAAAVREEQLNRTTQARFLREQADQLRTRMAARIPVTGSLTFLDSRGTPHLKGIDVGQEQSRREPRSHIEGGTPATAIWSFGVVPDPYDPRARLDRRIPVDQLLRRDTIEWYLNRVYELRYQIAGAEQEQGSADLPPARAGQLTARIGRNRAELGRMQGAHQRLVAEAKGYGARAKEAEAAGRATEAHAIRRQGRALHSPPIPLELTFNVYRTTKGRVGEPVFASIVVTNPRTGAEPYSNIFPIREYYTNKLFLPSEILAGSRGALRIEIRCLSPTQYLGMAERDLYILGDTGKFGTNFMKGLFGVWLQAMVLTAIGAFAGAFLSWPVALLTTIAFFVAGQVAFDLLMLFTQQGPLGGSPFESLIRLLSHENQMSKLDATAAVVMAKTLDDIAMPVMSRLVYIVPNFSALDVSDTVADGFAVGWGLMAANLLLALAYALPFSIAGYFILKHREVAA